MFVLNAHVRRLFFLLNLIQCLKLTLLTELCKILSKPNLMIGIHSFDKWLINFRSISPKRNIHSIINSLFNQYDTQGEIGFDCWLEDTIVNYWSLFSPCNLIIWSVKRWSNLQTKHLSSTNKCFWLNIFHLDPPTQFDQAQTQILIESKSTERELCLFYCFTIWLFWSNHTLLG